MATSGGGDNVIIGQQSSEVVVEDVLKVKSDLAVIFGDKIAEEIPEHLMPEILSKCSKTQNVPGGDLLSQIQDELSKKTSEVEELRANLDEARYNVSNIQERNSALTAEKEELEREKDRLATQKLDTEEASQKRHEEHERLVADHRALLEELSQAKSAKCEALIQIQDLESREISLQKREQRISEDRELVEQRFAALSEDLHQTREELVAVKRESGRQVSELESQLSAKVEAFSKLETEKEILIQDRDVLRSRLETVILRLNEAKSETAQVEEAYKQEIQAQTNYAEIYKRQADESEAKCKELEKAVNDYQSLLKEASHRYGALEDQYEADKAEQKEELSRKTEVIQDLKRQLDEANSFVTSMKKKGLTDEGIAQLSPAAAAASKLIKSDMSLTQVFAQLVACKEDLLKTEDENRRLNAYINQILEDLKERTTPLKRQREDYERAVEKLHTTSEKLREETEAHEKTKQNEDFYRKSVDALNAENARLHSQVKDLGKQVATLLQEVEEREIDVTSDETDRFVTFRNIEELQQRNTELLSLVRDMTAERESVEFHIIEERTKELRQKIEVLTSEVQVLRQEKKTQEAVCQSVTLQKDMLKSMLESSNSNMNESMEVIEQPQVTSTPRGVSPSAGPMIHPLKVKELEQRAIAAETELEELKKEFDEYRVDKAENEKILLEQFESARDNLNESRSKAIQFESQDSWNVSKDKISQTTISFYKKEIGNLEKKNETLQNIISKHETTIEKLHKYNMESSTKLMITERKLAKAEMDVKHLKNVESRLTKERDLLQRQKTSVSLVTDNLQLAQAQLEGAEHMQKIVLQNENASLKKEFGIFKNKLQSEEERHVQAAKTWQETEIALKAQLDQLTEREGQAKKSLEEMTNLTEGLKEQLKLIQGSSSSTPGGEVTNTQKVTDLQGQVRTLKNEVVTLKDQLSKLRQESSKHQSRADLAEKQAAESGKVAKSAQEELEKQSTAFKQEKSNLESKVSELSSERDKLSERLTNLGVIGDPAERMQKELDSARTQLEEATRELLDLRETKAQLEQDLTQQTNLATESKSRYEIEVMKCGQTTKTVKELRDKLNVITQEKGKLENEKRQTKDVIDNLKKNCSDLEAKFSELRTQHGLVEDENRALHEQLFNMSQQMTSHHDSSNPNEAINLSLTGAENNPDRLIDIVKYLRREKDILVGKVKVIEAESSRVKIELESTKRELLRHRSSLEAAAERAQSESALPSAKFKDLQDKVDIIPALTDANRTLRSEKEKLEKSLDETREQLKEIEPLRQKVKEIEEKDEKSQNLIKALKTDGYSWKQKALQLTELNKKLSPEELKRLEGENLRLSKQVTTMQNTIKQQGVQIQALNQKINANEVKWTNAMKTKDAELTKATQEAQLAKNANQAKIERLNLMIKKVAELEAANKQALSEKDGLKASIDQLKSAETQANAKTKAETEALQKSLQEKVDQTNTVIKSLREQNNKLRALGRDFKSKYENSLKEVTEKNNAITKLEEQLKKLQEDLNRPESEKSATRSDVVSSPDDRLAEAETLVEQSVARIGELEEKIGAMEEETKKLKDSSKEKEDRARTILFGLKNKLKSTQEDNVRLNNELKALQTLTTSAATTTSTTPASASAAANVKNLKAEFEAQLTALKLEKDQLLKAFSSEKQKLIREIEELKQKLSKQEQELLNLHDQCKAATETVQDVEDAAAQDEVSLEQDEGEGEGISSQENLEQVAHELFDEQSQSFPPVQSVEADEVIEVREEVQPKPSASTLNPDAPVFIPVFASHPTVTIEDDEVEPTANEPSTSQKRQLDEEETQGQSKRTRTEEVEDDDVIPEQPQLEVEIAIEGQSQHSTTEQMEDAENEVVNLDEDDGMEEEDEEQARQIAHAIEIVEGEDQDGPEVEISLEEDERRETGSNPDQRPQEDVLDSEEDDEAVLHLQQEEEEELPIHQDEGSRGSAAVVPEMISRSSSSHEVSSASVSGSMMRDEQSPEPETDHPSNIVEAVHLQHHVPIGSVRIDGSQPFDDAADDSVVPSTPKLVVSQSGHQHAQEGYSESTSNDPRFVFGVEASESGAVLVDDSTDADVAGADESGLAAQGGIDNFSIDISQFAEHHHQQQSQMVPGSSCEAQRVVPVSGVEGDELLEVDISELHEEIDLDDDVDEDVVSVVEPTRQETDVSVEEGGTAGSSGQTSDSQVDSDSSQQPQQQREVGGSRPPRISRTPIVWSATSDVTQPAPQLELQARPQGSAAAVRGASARRARGLPPGGRGGRGGPA